LALAQRQFSNGVRASCDGSL